MDISRVLKLLREVEWCASSPMYGENMCPVCRALFGDEHHDPCDLASMIKELEQLAPSNPASE